MAMNYPSLGKAEALNVSPIRRRVVWLLPSIVAASNEDYGLSTRDPRKGKSSSLPTIFWQN